MAMTRFLDITDFSRAELKETLNLMSFLKDSPASYASECAGRSVLTAFFAPDRNAEAAFHAATVRLGGQAFSFAPTEGETLKDTVLTMSSCGDVIVLNHPKKGAARAASLYADVPVINVGDGNRAQPVRTLADFSSVWALKNHISNMKVGFLGDLNSNALIHGLVQCLSLYNGNEFIFISVNGRELPKELAMVLSRRERPFTIYRNLFDILPQLDVLYMTKLEPASFDSETDYEAKKRDFILDSRLLTTAKKSLVILHDLPRGEELPVSVDSDPRAGYFAQLDHLTEGAMAALIKVVKGRSGKRVKPLEYEECDGFCGNDDCITSTEPYLPTLFHETADGRVVCDYCGGEMKS